MFINSYRLLRALIWFFRLKVSFIKLSLLISISLSPKAFASFCIWKALKLSFSLSLCFTFSLLHFLVKKKILRTKIGFLLSLISQSFKFSLVRTSNSSSPTPNCSSFFKFSARFCFSALSGRTMHDILFFLLKKLGKDFV